MNTPSKEALEAAKELVYSYDPKAHEAGARAIDRHFEPLRQRSDAWAKTFDALSQTPEYAETASDEPRGVDLALRTVALLIEHREQHEARVKELEALAQAQMAKLEEIHTLRFANAELAGALRGAREELYSLREFVIDRNVTDETSDGIQDADAALAKADAALARHAAGEPAKHPDTERLEAIEDGGLDVFESDGEWYVGAAEPCRTLRAAIDAAAAKHCKEVQS